MPQASELHSQYEALTARAGMADLSGRALIEIGGADRASLLHSFCTNEVKKLAVGQGCEAFITNPQGKTIGHGYLFNLGDSLRFDTVLGEAPKLIQHWDRYVLSEDVTFRDLSASHAELLLAGPEAAEVLRQATGGEPPTASPGCVPVLLAENRVWVKRLDYVASDSYFIESERDSLPAVFTALEAAGATACRTEVVEIARIEHGTPVFGQEITDDNLPQELNRDAKAISFTKGCYLGQETVARIDALGHVNRLLVGVKITGPVPPAGAPLLAEGKEVGRITSACESPKLSATLALALVRRAQAKAGTRLTCDKSDAVVVPLPV